MFRLPAALGPIALQNKALMYGLLLKAAAETLITLAGDRKHLGAKIGVTAILHTWGMPTCSSLVAAFRRMASVGLPASPGPFFRRSSRPCSGACSSKV